jgi:hypothetical protein
VTSLNELKLRIVAAIQKITPQMLENTGKKLNTAWTSLLATKSAHIKVI